MDYFMILYFYITILLANPSLSTIPPNRCEIEYQQTISALAQATLLTPAEKARFIQQAQQRYQQCQQQLRWEEEERKREIQRRMKEIADWLNDLIRDFWSIAPSDLDSED